VRLRREACSGSSPPSISSWAASSWAAVSGQTNCANIAFRLKLTATALSLVLLFAVSEAPHVHFHQNAASEHSQEAHQGRNISVHVLLILGVDRHQSRGVEIEAAPHHDDDAIFLSWLQSGPQGKAPFIVALRTSPAVAVPDVRSQELASLPSSRSHDPPLCPSTSPRSPPSFTFTPFV